MIRPSPEIGFPRWRVGLTAAFLVCLAGTASADPPARSVLHLIDGSQLPGELRGGEANVVRWQTPAFAGPLEFPITAVRAVHYPAAGPPTKPSEEYGFELVGDDVIHGDLLALTDDAVEISSAALGKVRLRRDQVRRIFRLQGSEALYSGPAGLAGWTDGSPTAKWREEGGELVTDQPGATIYADVNLPETALIEIELSWRLTPDFVLAFGVGEKDRGPRSGFRFEVWEGHLVAIVESARGANIAVVEQAGSLGGRVHLLAYIDQRQRRMILASPAGKLLATMTVPGGKSQPQSGVRLTNVKGDVRLEALRVTRWSGVSPQDVRDDQPRLHRADGAISYGQLAAFDPATKQFTVRSGGAENVVAQDAVGEIVLAPPRRVKPAARTVRIMYRDGARVGGTLTRVEDDHVTLACPAAEEPLRLPLAGARSLVVLRHDAAPPAATAAGRPGRLEVGGASLKGRLVEAPAGLAWRPDLAAVGSELAAGLSARILYREPPPPPAAPRPPQTLARAGGGIGFARVAVPVMVMNGEVVTPGAPPPPPMPSSGKRSMYLRTGDTIPCDVIRIDETGVTFKAPTTDATFVPNDKIKSVELIPARDLPGPDEAKRDRLLTLPRMQRDAPPTHLIVSTTGDFLRGRIVEMDDARLKVEVRLETRDIPRDRVAQIIWLHADELGDTQAAPAPAAPAKEMRAQTVDRAGNRMTFVVTKSDGKSVSGKSDVLGAVRANLADVDELLLGSMIEQSAAKLAYNGWKLHHAPDPKFVKGDGKEEGPSGTESPLVGQPAPAFQLAMLDGSKFKLANRKGKVVVLDFWATWCGPCMQSMPLVEEVVRDFANNDVELLAVNMEEQPDQVKAVLERHKFNVRVAIDRDGAVAGKYAVTAIPQTVIIDRDGKVARLFVGGGKATADALRKALQELTGK
jgi:thiol-disulfide isomerase/thioredoxin